MVVATRHGPDYHFYILSLPRLLIINAARPIKPYQVFGGCYFNPSGGKKGVKYPRGNIPVDHKEYPQDWFDGVPEHMYLSRRYNILTNKYRVKSGQDQAAWETSGWIAPQDPRGWFQVSPLAEKF